MGHLNKRARHLRDAREIKRQRRLEETDKDCSTDILHEAHWEGLSESEEESDVEISEPEDNISDEGKDAFEKLLSAAKREWSNGVDASKFLYQRGPSLCKRQQRRVRAAERDLTHAAKIHSQPLSQFFSPASLILSKVSVSASELHCRLRQEAIEDLEKKLRSKKTVLEGQNFTRHRAVLALLYMTRTRKGGDTREELSCHVARTFNKGLYFARRVVEWEGIWMRERKIPEGKQGCFVKTFSWYNDEGVQLAVREWCAGAGESKFSGHLHKLRTKMFTSEITAFGLAKAVGEYLDSRRAIAVINESLQDAAHSSASSFSLLPDSTRRIRARTARRWLKKMGFVYKDVKKDVYFDGHEREDVVKYRNEVFLKNWQEFSRRFVIFEEDGSWEKPPGLRPGEKPMVLVTHDESTFNANDGKRRLWLKQGEQPLRPKGKGKGIMVSGFLTPGGILRVPDHVPDAELLTNPTWPRDDKGKPVREAIEYLEYGKDNYWTGEKMVEHTTHVAIPIFNYAFPNCKGLFAFDNASNHSAFAADALVVAKMNLMPGGKQPLLRDGWDHNRDLPQPMIFSQNHPDTTLRGKPKGIQQVLRERGLWRDRRADGSKFLLICPNTHGRPGCDPALNGECCATALLQSQRDFQEQKGWLQEKVEAAGHSVIFYPKFHCELNFIERFWCAAKHYVRENCVYTIDGLRTTIPAAFNSIPTATTNRFYKLCSRIIDAYINGYKYGTKAFIDQVHKSHRRVIDKSKW